MTRVITIEREYGSGAGAIARHLANQLGWTLWDREISEEIARRLKCHVDKVEEREERLDPTYYRLMKAFMRGSFEESFGGKGVELLDAESLSKLFERVITEVADRGNCVIVGRAAPWFLRNRTDALHFFLYAPYQDKLNRVTGMGKSSKEAEDLVASVDAERAAFVKKYYGKQWPTRELYHAMLNTALGTDNVIKLILTEMGLVERRSAMSA